MIASAFHVRRDLRARASASPFHSRCVSRAPNDLLHSMLGVECQSGSDRWALDVFHFRSPAPVSFRISGIGLAQRARPRDASGKCIAAHAPPPPKRPASELIEHEPSRSRKSQRQKIRFVLSFLVVGQAPRLPNERRQVRAGLAGAVALQTERKCSRSKRKTAERARACSRPIQ